MGVEHNHFTLWQGILRYRIEARPFHEPRPNHDASLQSEDSQSEQRSSTTCDLAQALRPHTLVGKH